VLRKHFLLFYLDFSTLRPNVALVEMTRWVSYLINHKVMRKPKQLN